MHLVTDAHGRPACYHCGRHFDRDPRTARSEAKHAKLCAIPDDDHAARAFHFEREMRAKEEKMTTVWIQRQGMYLDGVGSITSEGIQIRIEPDVSHERLMAEFIDVHLWPTIRQSILDTLDGTAQRQEEEGRLKILARRGDAAREDHDLWCPSEPSVQELYPNGYVRHADGTVEAR